VRIEEITCHPPSTESISTPENSGGRKRAKESTQDPKQRIQHPKQTKMQARTANTISSKKKKKQEWEKRT
jgi:hypothetical protein